MSFKLRFSKRVVKDIDEVLAHTAREFGEDQYKTYKKLIRLALADITANPDQFPARRHPALHPDSRLFHIERPGRNARHYFFYWMMEGKYVLLGGLLHDAMDVQRNVPRKFRE